ncbi:MAG TPA: hypothetical protein VK991_14665 [Halomonas sp.]|nr:hypothetical protein [Halomonas sp.]
MKRRRFLVGATVVVGSAGRVFKAVPAPTNLIIPPYRFLSESRVEIGTDPKPTTS